MVARGCDNPSVWDGGGLGGEGCCALYCTFLRREAQCGCAHLELAHNDGLNMLAVACRGVRYCSGIPATQGQVSLSAPPKGFFLRAVHLAECSPIDDCAAVACLWQACCNPALQPFPAHNAHRTQACPSPCVLVSWPVTGDLVGARGPGLRLVRPRRLSCIVQPPSLVVHIDRGGSGDVGRHVRAHWIPNCSHFSQSSPRSLMGQLCRVSG
mmetsp:Transcript_114837/g.199769  ORF Transcript_114837/g.199769 Transcript_114837/m.199769 type:complete len:211 (-) Transcript_114837:87-719(-)